MENDQVKKPATELQKTLDDYDANLDDHIHFLKKMMLDNRGISDSEPVTKPSKSPSASEPSSETISEPTTQAAKDAAYLARFYAQNPGVRLNPESLYEEMTRKAENMKKELHKDMTDAEITKMESDMERINQELAKLSEYSKVEREKQKKK